MTFEKIDLPAAGGSRDFEFSGPAGKVQGIISMPRQSPRGIAVLCHPHPLYGGAMTNKVVYTLASCATKTGLAALRFNFRGVGNSEGVFDNGDGETDDLLAAVEWLRDHCPGQPLFLGGFSFGAYIALKASAQLQPRALVTISIPFGRYVDAAVNPQRPDCPWLAMHSKDDDVVEYDDTLKHLKSYDPPPELVTLDGAGHFYHGRLGDIQSAVLPFLENLW